MRRGFLQSLTKEQFFPSGDEQGRPLSFKEGCTVRRKAAVGLALLMLLSVALGLGETKIFEASSSAFAKALLASKAAEDRSEKLDLYGQFIGDWEADVVSHAPGGARHKGQGEIHFGWVLEGRAIQDVWMIPRKKHRRADSEVLPIAGNWYGTTIRVYDPNIDAWRIYWIDPATNSFRQQIGRKEGTDIIQEGVTETGALSRWSFTEITQASFHWKGEASTDNGATWRLFVEVFAKRAPD